MTLRDRIRRWWSPAQWRDDHPLEAGAGAATEGGRGNKRLGRWFGSDPLRAYDNIDLSGQQTGFERDFKKPR
jgi:hypothetical protein